MFASNTSQVSSDSIYVEDVFSTYLYKGTGSSQTITNGIDLSGEGGLVWTKDRNLGDNHILIDTVRGVNNAISSNLTNAQFTYSNTVTAFSSTGFTAGTTYNGYNVATFTFRKAKKFFDVVTYTGNGANRTIAHNLGSVPGCIIVKRTDTTADWQVYHRSLANTEYMVLNTTAAKATGATRWNSTTPTSTEFSLGTDATVNANGGTYVAYLFAHDAGGFGTAGTDNVISCGSYTGTAAAGNFVNLGYEPQWIMVKNASSGSTDWSIFDTMRGIVTSSLDAQLAAQSSAEENGIWGGLNWIDVNSTGFTPDPLGAGYGNMNVSGSTYIYIAIRRGPMKTPTTGTSVFDLQTYTGNSSSNTSTRTLSLNISPDATLTLNRVAGVQMPNIYDKLRGNGRPLWTAGTYTEPTTPNTWGITQGTNSVLLTGRWNDYGTFNNASDAHVGYYLRRAPGVFDVVCYTGNGASSRSITHNLTVAPEMMIVKSRNLADTSWDVWHTANGVPSVMYLNNTNAKSTLSGHFDTLPTASVFYVGGSAFVNESGYTYVAYLFASCPGVSKVGSYTGTGTTLQINCGFTSGARFVLIKRTDSTGDWYVWDTARGIVSGNDPYLLLNSTASETTSTDYIDPYSAGFEISSTAPAAINASGGTYIYLAIA